MYVSRYIKEIENNPVLAFVCSLLCCCPQRGFRSGQLARLALAPKATRKQTNNEKAKKKHE